jgi:hypothetical protein
LMKTNFAKALEIDGPGTRQQDRLELEAMLVNSKYGSAQETRDKSRSVSEARDETHSCWIQLRQTPSRPFLPTNKDVRRLSFGTF